MSALALEPESTALVLVDFQQKLAAAMPEQDRERATRGIDALLETARLLGLPVIVTEQYPKGLGSTVGPLQQRLQGFEPKPTVVEKTEFDACANGGFLEAFRSVQRPNVVLCGMEAHICVWQTARSLSRRGLSVHIPVDATCSRNPDNRRVAEGLWQRAGALVTSTETVLFDLVGRSGTDTFRAVSKLVR